MKTTLLLVLLAGCSLEASPTETHWDVIAVSAAIAPKNPVGNDWDADRSPPDAYATCLVDGVAQGHTAVVADDYRPLWGDTICTNLTGAQLTDGFRVRVADVDGNAEEQAGEAGPLYADPEKAESADVAAELVYALGQPLHTGSTVFLRLIPRP